jgi:hypothetical protein
MSEITPKPRKKSGPPPVAQDKLTAVGTQAICDLILEGHSYRQISAQFGVGLATLVAWMDADAERSQACARARESASQSYDEKALESIERANDAFELAKAREAAIHLRWRAKAVNPRRYGEKVAVGGAEDLPPVRTEVSDLKGLDSQELSTLKTLLAKGKAALEAGDAT